jgi:hypothetical protein
MRTPVEAPTLQLHGALDPCVLPRTALGSGRYVAAGYRWRLIEGAGHFPHEERPEQFDSELISWLSGPESTAADAAADAAGAARPAPTPDNPIQPTRNHTGDDHA